MNAHASCSNTCAKRHSKHEKWQHWCPACPPMQNIHRAEIQLQFYAFFENWCKVLHTPSSPTRLMQRSCNFMPPLRSYAYVKSTHASSINSPHLWAEILHASLNAHVRRLQPGINSSVLNLRDSSNAKVAKLNDSGRL